MNLNCCVCQLHQFAQICQYSPGVVPLEALYHYQVEPRLSGSRAKSAPSNAIFVRTSPWREKIPFIRLIVVLLLESSVVFLPFFMHTAGIIAFVH